MIQISYQKDFIPKIHLQMIQHFCSRNKFVRKLLQPCYHPSFHKVTGNVDNLDTKINSTTKTRNEMFSGPEQKYESLVRFKEDKNILDHDSADHATVTVSEPALPYFFGLYGEKSSRTMLVVPSIKSMLDQYIYQWYISNGYN
jgi:hypothetical protein